MAKKSSTTRRKKLAKALDLFVGSDDDLGITSAVSLQEAAQKRYLNYALSVITSRALPDVRDGLKPVQRRILYTMWLEKLAHPAKHRKCAGVVGSTMRDFHPHGDASIYDALVRMAQPFSMRMPMADGSGNFGSIDGDSAAAMRYTECRLAEPATEMLTDISAGTVPFRPNYDGTNQEPVVLPARLPALLINGTTGIAVGMATNIPPHNPGEVCRALLKVLSNPEIQDYQLVSNDAIQGPDFPTGGEITTSRDDLRDIYKTGQGSVRIRGTIRKGEAKGRSSKTLIIDSIPYGVNKSALVEDIAKIVIGRKMPLLLDVRDLSGEDILIELELKKDADVALVYAYLCKHTRLQVNFGVNLTCLIPTNNPSVGAPERLGLLEILRHFLLFRHQVVTARLEHELAILKKRLHLLAGFQIVFDALDEIITIIRKSSGKADAAKKIMVRFKQLDELQTEAILELKLYRLARLEINLITDEKKAKEACVKDIEKLLKDDANNYASGRWVIVREEIESLLGKYGDKVRNHPQGKRRTQLTTAVEEVEFKAEDFIVAEDAHILISSDGWIKRQKEIKDPSTSRMREGDSVLACLAAATTTTVLLFSNLGVCYSMRVIDIPATTGFGEPIQKFFKFSDGEKIIAAMSADPRVLKGIEPKKEGADPAVTLLVASSDGYASRLPLGLFVEPSTKAGRRYARPTKGHQVVGVQKVEGNEIILAATWHCHALACKCKEINLLANAGKGVQLVKLTKKDDRLVGFKASKGERDILRLTTNRGAEKTVSTAKYKVVTRGGKGFAIQSNGRIDTVTPDPVEPPPIL